MPKGWISFVIESFQYLLFLVKRKERMEKLSYDLNDLYLFNKVISLNGFTAAAKALGIPKSKISRRLTTLEESLGLRLIQRNSRSIGLTDAGRRLYEFSQQIVHNAEEGEIAVRNSISEPNGLVRVSFPDEITRAVFSKIIPKFMSMHPKVSLNIEVSNRIVNLIEDGFDLVIRGGISVPEESSTIICTKISHVGWALVCSPEYIRVHGQPAKIDELADLSFLAYSADAKSTVAIRFMSCDGANQVVNLKSRLACNNHNVLREAAKSGLGIASLPLYSCNEELDKGSLVRILPQWSTTSGDLFALFPTKLGLASATRTFLDFIKSEGASYIASNIPISD